MHTNSVIEAEQEGLRLRLCQMLNPTDSIDRRILDPNEAAALLSCNGNSESFASRSRNQDFHALFPDISPAELLCDDFSCGNSNIIYTIAWQREVLLQGRLYLTQRNVYFYSKILWVYRVDYVTLQLVDYSLERCRIDREKKRFRFWDIPQFNIHKNGLWKSVSRHQTIPMRKLNSNQGMEHDSEDELPFLSLDDLRRGSFDIYDSDLSDLEGRDKFSNVVNNSPVFEMGSDTRESAIDGVSKKRHAQTKSNSIPIPEKRNALNRGISTRSAPEAQTSFSGKYPDQNQFESFQMMDSKSFVSPKSITSREDNGPLGLIDLAREPELPSLKNIELPDNPQIFHQKHVINPPIINEADSLVVLSTPMVSFSPISCDCNLDLTKFKVLIDHSFHTNVDNLWKILFGNVFSTDGFIRKFWTDMGYKGIQISSWEPDCGESDKKESVNQNMLLEDMQVGYIQKLEYIVPSTNPVGPKEIHTFLKHRVIGKEGSNSTICLLQVSTTPFVTSGDCFEVHIKTCLTHDGHGVSKLRVAAQVVFIKSTWIRMIIERAAIDALSNHFEKLVKALDSHLSAHQTPKIPLESTKSKIPTEPLFIHHPLEKELCAMKKEEEALRKKNVVDLKIWKKLSSIDILWFMFLILLYMSYWIFQMYLELNLLKSKLEYLTESLKKP